MWKWFIGNTLITNQHELGSVVMKSLPSDVWMDWQLVCFLMSYNREIRPCGRCYVAFHFTSELVFPSLEVGMVISFPTSGIVIPTGRGVPVANSDSEVGNSKFQDYNGTITQIPEI